MDWLFVIPARAGSQRLPGKNVKPLGGKPLISYTVEAARQVTEDRNIFVSTDSSSIKELVEATGLEVPALRPKTLAGHHSGMREVLLHALTIKNTPDHTFDGMVLLQPTSPFRTATHIREAMSLFQSNLDMVVSVKLTSANPYYVLFEEDTSGFLYKSKEGHFVRAQDCPPVYELNGAIYVINTKSLEQKTMSAFTRVRKYVMDEASSLDIDTPLDWLVAETLLHRLKA
ncbi:MAG: acylneuraminate cytidylyltransferase family protein [Saprospiraceae bacterium]|nr:acylneuraminate cytidylyltransferase family protein [Saprospiraceae bacterium]